MMTWLHALLALLVAPLAHAEPEDPTPWDTEAMQACAGIRIEAEPGLTDEAEDLALRAAYLAKLACHDALWKQLTPHAFAEDDPRRAARALLARVRLQEELATTLEQAHTPRQLSARGASLRHRGLSREALRLRDTTRALAEVLRQQVASLPSTDPVRTEALEAIAQAGAARRAHETRLIATQALAAEAYGDVLDEPTLRARRDPLEALSVRCGEQDLLNEAIRQGSLIDMALAAPDPPLQELSRGLRRLEEDLQACLARRPLPPPDPSPEEVDDFWFCDL